MQGFSERRHQGTGVNRNAVRHGFSLFMSPEHILIIKALGRFSNIELTALNGTFHRHAIGTDNAGLGKRIGCNGRTIFFDRFDIIGN